MRRGCLGGICNNSWATWRSRTAIEGRIAKKRKGENAKKRLGKAGGRYRGRMEALEGRRERRGSVVRVGD
jgi:hypothetical protein